MSALRESRVAVAMDRGAYCAEAPYHPSEAYPEALVPGAVGAADNPAYRAVRELFLRLGMDSAHAGTAEWNPLGELVKPGDTVLLKPNFVVSRHGRGGELFAAITHPSVLRAVADYAFLALGGAGRVIVADAPQMDCDWEQLMAATRLPEVAAFYAARGRTMEIVDLRDFCVANPDEQALYTNRRALPGDPLGNVIFDLGERSHFFGVQEHDRFYGADYDRQETIRHHHGAVHEYSVSRTVLSADVVISIPKMKVHKKVGVTLNIKGLVGINTNKNYLVHYRVGTPAQGGDQLPDRMASGDRWLVRTQRFLFDQLLARRSRAADAVYNLIRHTYRFTLKPFMRVSENTVALDGGNWHGNDTAWRMAVDLLKILRFGRADGTLQATPQRRVLCIVDGITGGEGDGPLAPDPRPAGCMVGGVSPLAVDLVTTRLMGIDPGSLRQFSILDEARGWDFGIRSMEEIEVHADDPAMRHPFSTGSAFLDFRPHPGWVGRVEAARPAEVAA